MIRGGASVSVLIKRYGLKAHPEGGYFKETYRSKGKIPKTALPRTFRGARNYSTAIYFLLPEGQKSRLHRIKSDEIWHFYLGGPLVITQISPAGKLETVILGQNGKKGELLQHMVAAGWWFGAYPKRGSGYSFVGCTVSPGFEFADLDLADCENLLRRFPRARTAIEKLTERR